MKKLFIILVILLSIEAFAKTPVPCKSEEHLLIEKGIDIDTKSIKGWIRILNNRSKQNEIGINLSREETIELIKCLTIELNNRNHQGKMQWNT